MTIWQTVTWDVARAGGFTAFGLLTLSVAVGLALTLHLQSPRWPRIINSELHNFLTLLALIFTGVHVLAVWVDPFTHFGWNEVFLPLASHYRPLWMAFGIVALYIGIAIGLSTWLRPYIGYKWWRRLHVLTVLLYGLVVVHGIATGSDTRTWWGAAIYLLSVLLIGILFLMRLMKPANAQTRAHPVLAGAVVTILAIGTFLTLIGPLQPGWNARANNASGTTGATRANNKNSSNTSPAAPSQSSALPQAFTSNLQGQLTQNGPDANGNVTLQLNLSMLNGPAGNVQVILQGQTGGDDSNVTITSSHVTLASNAGQQLYAGSLNSFSSDDRWNMTASLTGTGTNSSSQLQVQITVRVYANGQATGTITAGSIIPTGTSA